MMPIRYEPVITIILYCRIFQPGFTYGTATPVGNYPSTAPVLLWSPLSCRCQLRPFPSSPSLHLGSSQRLATQNRKTQANLAENGRSLSTYGLTRGTWAPPPTLHTGAWSTLPYLRCIFWALSGSTVHLQPQEPLPAAGLWPWISAVRASQVSLKTNIWLHPLGP